MFFIIVIAGHGMLAYESSHTGKGTCIKCFLKATVKERNGA